MDTQNNKEYPVLKQPKYFFLTLMVIGALQSGGILCHWFFPN